MSGEAHFRSLAHGQRSSELRRDIAAVATDGDSASDLTSLEMEVKTPAPIAEAMSAKTTSTGRYVL